MQTKYFTPFFLFIFCSAAFWAPANGQSTENLRLQTRSIGVNENLGKFRIHEVLQDKYGFYWLAAAEGIYRFDGKHCTYYDKGQLGLKKTDFLRADQDAEDNIWIWGMNQENFGISGYQHKSLQRLQPLSASADSIKTTPFLLEEGTTSIVEENNRLFVIKYDTQVFELRGDFLHYLFSGASDQLLSDVVWSEQNQVYYFLSCEDLYSYDPSTQQKRRLTNSSYFRFFTANQDGLALYFFLEHKLSSFPNYQLFSFEDQLFGPIFEQKEGNYSRLLGHSNKEWCVNKNDQLTFLTQNGTSIDTTFSLSYEDIFEVDERPEKLTYLNGVYWFFFHHYVKVVSIEKARFQAHLQYASPISIRDFEQDPKNEQLYLSTYSGHRMLNLKTGDVKRSFPQVADQYSPYRMAISQDSVLYVGMHGLSLIRKNLLTQKNAFLHASTNVLGTSIAFLNPFFDPQNRLWIGCERGLIRLPSVTGQPQLNDYSVKLLENKTIEFVRQDINPRFFWLATSKGAYLLDTEQEMITDSLRPFTDRPIEAIIPQGKDSVWVLPAEDDAYLWHRPTNTWDTLKLYQSALQNSLHSLQRDPSGAYWFTSDNGLLRYDPLQKKNQHFTQEKDGIPFNEFNKLAFDTLRDGRFLAGGVNGFISWNPLDFRPSSDEYQGKVQLQSIRFSTNTAEINLPLSDFVDKNTHIQFPAKLNQLQFDFDLMDAMANNKHYYFRLTKKQEPAQWSKLEQGKLILSGLSSGTHQLQLGIKEGRQQDFTDQLRIQLEVARPWYASTLGLLLWGLLLAGLIRLIVHLRLRQAIEKNQKLEALISERTLEIEQDRLLIQQQNQQLEQINNTKDRLFGLLGHELRAPLMGVMGLSKKVSYLLRKGQLKELEKVSTQLDRYAIDTQSMLQNLLNWGQVMTGATEPIIEDIQLSDLVEELIPQMSEKIDQKQLKVQLDLPIDSYLAFDEDALLIILRNLLDNAIKFSHPGGSIRISFSTRPADSAWQLCIADEGIGMPPEQSGTNTSSNKVYSRSGTQGEKGSGLGLHLCRELANRNQCSLSFKANQPQGTIAILNTSNYT